MIINKLREKLHDSIQKFGLSSKETYNVSLELDEAIINYYQNSPMLYYYKISLEGLKKYIKDNNREPSKIEWNKYAYENNFLSSESMKYIGNINLK